MPLSGSRSERRRITLRAIRPTTTTPMVASIRTSPRFKFATLHGGHASWRWSVLLRLKLQMPVPAGHLCRQHLAAVAVLFRSHLVLSGFGEGAVFDALVKLFVGPRPEEAGEAGEDGQGAGGQP